MVATAGQEVDQLRDLTPLSNAPSPDAFVAELRGSLEALAACGPVLLVIEDLHWADLESLAFLRVFDRSARALPIVLLATYRDDDLAANQAAKRPRVEAIIRSMRSPYAGMLASARPSPTTSAESATTRFQPAR